MLNRRQFIASSAALLGTSFLPSCSKTSVPTAVDLIPLGKTGIMTSRIGVGTGTLNSGTVQIAIGQDAFTRLIHYAYDQGINFIDTSVGYRTLPWISGALKGLPREKLFIQSKLETRTENPAEAITNLCKSLGVDYIDCVLVHGVSAADWNKNCQPLMDALSAAKEKGIIRAHGASYHGIPALTTSTQMDWIESTLIRYNVQGVYMDPVPQEGGASSNTSSVAAVEEQMKILKSKGKGILAMKVFGEGRLVEAADRAASIRYAIQAGYVDVFDIGFKSTAEIDEAIWHVNQALAEIHTQKNAEIQKQKAAEIRYRIAV